MKYSTIVLLGLIALSDVQALKINNLEDPPIEEKKVVDNRADKKEAATKADDPNTDCYEIPRGDKQSKCFNDIKESIEVKGNIDYNSKLKEDGDYAKKNNEFRDKVQSDMKKENVWTNGGKKIEGKGGEQKKGWDVPMDEQNAHPSLKEPSDPEKIDKPIAMKWVDNKAPKKEEAKK